MDITDADLGLRPEATTDGITDADLGIGDTSPVDSADQLVARARELGAVAPSSGRPGLQFMPRSSQSAQRIESATDQDIGLAPEQVRALVERIREKKGQSPLQSRDDALRPTDNLNQLAAAYVAAHGGTVEAAKAIVQGLPASRPLDPVTAATPEDENAKLTRLRAAMANLPVPEGYLPDQGVGSRLLESVSRGSGRDVATLAGALPALGEQGLAAIGVDAPTPYSDSLRELAQSEQNDQTVNQMTFQKPGRVVGALDSAARSAPSALLTLPLGAEALLAKTAGKVGLNLAVSNVAKETAKQVAIRSAAMAVPGGLVSAGQSVGQDLADGGYSPLMIVGRGILQGALEAGGEALPVGGHFGGEATFISRLMAAADRRGVGQQLKKMLMEAPPELVAQGVQEGITSLTQSLAGDMTSKDSVSFGQMLANASDQAIDGALSGMMMGIGFQAPHMAKAGVSDVADQFAMRKALGEIQSAPVEQQAAQAAAMEPGRAPAVPDTRPDLGSMRAAALAQEQSDPGVQADVAPVAQVAPTQMDAPAAPVDPAVYDPAVAARQAEDAATAAATAAVPPVQAAPVATAAAPQKPAKGVKTPAPAKAQAKGDWAAFDPQETLGVPRAAMPQVETADRPALMEWMKSQGIRSNTETVDPATLKPTQAEFSPTKIKAAGQQMAADRAAGKPVRPILVSKDGYVIDGHHQWLAAKQAGEQVPVIRIDAPAAQALQTIKRFPKAKQASGATAPAKKEANAGRSPTAAPGVQPPAQAPPLAPVAAQPASAAGGAKVAAAADKPAPASGANPPLSSGVASSQPEAKPVVSGEQQPGATQARPAEPAASPQGIAGDATTIDVPGGQDMPAAYEVRELDSLIASGDYSSGSVTKNGQYPADLQPRDYSPGNTEDVKVQSFAQGQKAGYYINTDPSAANGPPTVTANGTVLNGNGRTMSLQLAASRGDMGWYRRELDRLASVFGLNPDSYKGMRQPVLVRVAKVEPTSEAAKRFARQGNVSSTQAQSPARTAASLGNLVDQGVLDTIDLEDEATTFSEAVSGPAGKDFRQALAAALPAQEVPRYLNEQTGQLTEAGKELVRDLLLTKQLPVELIERVREDRKALLRSLEQAVPQLMRLDGIVPESRVNDHLTEALEWISHHPDVTLPTQLVDSVDASGKPTQQTLTESQDGMSPEARMLAEWLLGNAQRGKSSKPGLVSLIRGLENRSSPILGDTRSGGQIAADALGVPLAPGAEFGVKGEKQSPPRMSFRKEVDNSVETADLAKSLRAGMPAASAVTFIPDGPFGYRVESKGKPVVRVRVALPQDLERIKAPKDLNGWAEGSTIYLVPGSATAYTYNHEMVHALVNLGVLTRAEVEKLANLAHKTLPRETRDGIKKAYADASPGMMTEEMAAHVIEAMAENKARPSMVDRVLAWLRDMAAMLKLTSQSDYGLAKDVASGKILDKRDASAEAGNDKAKQSRRIDAPGQQSLFGEQIPAPQPKAKPEPKPEAKPEPSATERAVEKLTATVDKLLEKQATLFDLLAGKQAAASTPAPGADTQAGGSNREARDGRSTDGRGPGAAGARSGDGRGTDAGTGGAGERGADRGAAEGGSPGYAAGGTRGADRDGAGVRSGRQQPDGGRPDAVRGSQPDERGAPTAPVVEQPAAIRPTGFRYNSVEEAMPPRGDISRARANLAAVHAYQAVAREGRAATAEERATIAKFSGWGSLKWVFKVETANQADKSRRDIYHEAVKVMKAEDRAMAELANDAADEAMPAPAEKDGGGEPLDGPTRQRAIASTLNAHYTHPQVVADTWKMVEGMLGDRIPYGTRILEPSVGMGVFIGLEPQNLRGRSAWTAVELDQLTCGMVRSVYSDAAVVTSGFEQFSVPDNSYDVAISNFPFGSYRLYDRRYNKVGRPLIHDYFFLKSMDKVRPGGLVVGITSTGTMDKSDDTVRRALYEQGDLVQAIRFPANAHDTAGTAVVTDLLIFRKRMPGEAKGSDAWLKTGTVPDAKGGSAIPINQHFIDNPGQVLGTIERSGQLHGRDVTGEKRPNVVKRDSYEQELKAAMASAPTNIVPQRPATDAVTVTIPAPAELKPGAMVGKDGKVWQKQGAELVLVNDGKNAAFRAERIGWMRAIVANLRAVWKAELNGSAAEAERAVLNKTYDAGFKRFGAINDRENARLFAADPDSPNIQSLEVLKSDENDEENQVWGKGPSFDKPMLRPATVMGQAKNATEGVAQSLGMTGMVDPQVVAKSMGVSVQEAEAAMRRESSAFEDPASGWQAKWVYLSGNVKAKLAGAKEAMARDGEKWAGNVKALEAVQPRDREANEITPTLGAAWVPAEVFGVFLSQKAPGVQASMGAEGRWILSGNPSDVANATWGVKGIHKRATAVDIARAAFNGSAVKMAGRDEDGKTLPDIDSERAATEKANRMRAEFLTWIRAADQTGTMAEVVKSYNDIVNVYHREQVDDSWLTFDGLNPKFATDPQRRRGVARALAEGRIFLAHDVGTGKTVTLTAIAIESKRLGLSKKPVIATLNNVVAQFGRDALEAYPGKNILIQPAEWGEPGTPTSRSAFMSRLATQDYDVAIISHETLTGIKNDPQAEAEHIQDKIKELEEALRQSKENSDKSQESKRAVAALAKRIEKMRKDMLELQSHVLKRDHITFEDMGIDQLLIDEAHQFKNLGIITAQERILGLGGGDSTRAEDLLIKAKTLHARNGNERGLMLATGTPISNSMVEVFAFQSMMQPSAMKVAKVEYFDNWSRAFGTTKQTNEVQADGTRKAVTRYSEWVNAHGLSAMLREFMDVAFTSDIPRVWDALPAIQEVPVKVPLSERQRAYRELIGERLEDIKKNGKPEKGDDIALVAMRDAMLSSLDMRLVDPKAGPNDGGKLMALIENVSSLYKNGPRIGTKFPTQFIFQNVQSNPNAWGFSVNNTIVAGLVAAGIPANRIAVLDGNMSKTKRNKIKSEAKAGKYAVLIGSTEVLGTGTNAQDYALATHHIDIPYRPADIIQRDGRMRRQGNKYAPKRKDGKVVEPGVTTMAHRYVTEGTMDEALWAKLGLKANFIHEMLGAVATPSDASTMREVETEGLDPEMIAALASGDQDLIQLVELDEEVGRLRREKEAHYGQREYLLKQAQTYERDAEHHGRRFNTYSDLANTVEGKLPEKPQMDGGVDGKALTQQVEQLGKLAMPRWNTEIDRKMGAYAGVPVLAKDLTRHSESWQDLTMRVEYGGDLLSVEVKDGSGAALLGQLRQKAKSFSERAADNEANAQKYTRWAKNNQTKADAVGEWPKEAEYTAKANERTRLDAVVQSKPRPASSLSDEARADFYAGMNARAEDKANKEQAKKDRASAAAPKLSRRITAMTEEATKNERDIVNPIDQSLSPEAKAAELAKLTDENRRVVEGIVQKARAMGLMEAKDNVKAPANVVSKASRPSILAEKPWHQVEHIRDSYRFKLPVKRLQQMEDMLRLLLDAGATIVKYDSAKLFKPKEWGWRFVGMDLRMPNGQIVEVYIPFESMDADAVKGPNHHLFEKWRNLTPTDTAIRAEEKAADVAESRARYDAAWNQGLQASGLAGESEARAAFTSIEDRIASLMEAKVSMNSAALTTDKYRSLASQDAPPSRDISDSFSNPSTTASRPVSSSSQASSMARPSEGDDSAPGGDAMSDIRTGPMMSKRIGRPDLANPGTTGPVRGMMDQVDEARNQAGEPATKPSDEVEAAAEARFKADPEGERRKLMDMYRKGEFTDDVETRIAHHLINRDGLRAVTSGSADEMIAATKIMAMYRANGSDMARAFRARMDRMASPEERTNLLTQAILTPAAETIQKVRNAYENGKPQEAEAIMRKHAEEAKKVLDILKAQGIDPQDVLLGDKLVDPVTMARVIRTVSGLRGKSGIGDMLLEYWINAILSGPYTHVVNTVGNAASTGWDLTVQRWAEIAVGMATNADGKARAGELAPMYKALFKSLPKAAKNMVRSFQAEHDVFEWDVNGVPVAGQASGNKVEDRAAIKGTKGRIIRSATRALTAADSFWKTFIGHGQAAAEAYRTGVDRGLKGAQLDAYMASELADYGSKSWHNALGYAQDLTFQKEGGAILKGIQGIRNIEGPGGVKPFAFVLPFTRTPWNIMATGIRKTPLGSAALAYRLGKEGIRRSFDKDNADGAYAGRDAIRHAAEQVLAWGIMLAIAGMVYDRDDKDRPMITGTGTGFGKDAGKRELEGRVTPPLSIRIGNTWYSYGRIEPAATALGMIVDMLEAKRDGAGPSEMLGKTGGVLMEQVRNKTFLQGVSDLMNALEDPERFASRYTANFASSWMPNIIRQPLRATQEVMPEGKPLASEAGESAVGLWLRSVGRSMVPIESFGAPPKIDVWGREIPRTAQQNTSWLARMGESLTWPLPRRLDRGTELDLLLKSYNEAHPDEAWWPSTPAAYYKVNGKRVDMTEGQYNRFLRERGALAMQQLGGLRWDPKNPPQSYHIDMIQKALRRATTMAKANVLNDANADAYKQANNILSGEEKLDEVAKP